MSNMVVNCQHWAPADARATIDHHIQHSSPQYSLQDSFNLLDTPELEFWKNACFNRELYLVNRISGMVQGILLSFYVLFIQN